MSLQWFERKNLLEEYEHILKEFITDDEIKNIQYISIRRTPKWTFLIGVNDLSKGNKILDYSPRIIIRLKEYQEQKEDYHEKRRIPKRISVFEFSIDKKQQKIKEKRILEEKRRKQILEDNILYNKWKNKPFDFFKDTNKPEGIYTEPFLHIIEDNKIKPLIIDTDLTKGLLIKKYDFIVKDRYNKEWKYIHYNKSYFKYKSDFEIKVSLSNSIGYIEINNLNEIKTVSKTTYEKWEKQ